MSEEINLEMLRQASDADLPVMTPVLHLVGRRPIVVCGDGQAVILVCVIDEDIGARRDEGADLGVGQALDTEAVDGREALE